MHNEESAVAAIDAIDSAMRELVRAVYINKPVAVSVAEVVFANAPDVQSLRLAFAEPQDLSLEIQTQAGVWSRLYKFPHRCEYILRSIVGRFAFVVNAALIDALKTELGYIDDLVEFHERDDVTRYLLGTPKWIAEEATQRGIEEVNAYGFQTTLEMHNRSGKPYSVFFHTQNDNRHYPYFLHIENRGPVD